MEELVNLILACIENFEASVSAAGCGCEIPVGHEPTREAYLEFAEKFGLKETILKGYTHQHEKVSLYGTAVGHDRCDCRMAPLPALVYAWGFKHSAKVVFVTFADGMIRLHVHKQIEGECDELYKALVTHAPQFAVGTYREWYDKHK